MSRRKTRDRQLAKLAARRAAERRRKRRQRITAGVVAFAVAAAGGIFAFVAFTGGKSKPSAHPTTPTPTVTSTRRVPPERSTCRRSSTPWPAPSS